MTLKIFLISIVVGIILSVLVIRHFQTKVAHLKNRKPDIGFGYTEPEETKDK